MKKILIMAACLLSSAVFAQELFPELAGVGGRQRPATAQQKTSTPPPAPTAASTTEEDNLPSIPSTEESVTEESGETAITEPTSETPNQETDLFAPKQAEATQQAEQQEEQEEEDPEQRITVYLEDAQATITPNRNFSYCFGVLKFLNTLKRPVLALDIVLKYGSLTASYNVTNLMPQVEQTGSFNLLGDACERILDMPEVTINKCQVEDMDEKTCKKKFEFVPLRGE